MMIVRNLFERLRLQSRRWSISFLLGAILLSLLLWQASPPLNEEQPAADSRAGEPPSRAEAAIPSSLPRLLPNPDQWEGSIASAQIRLIMRSLAEPHLANTLLQPLFSQWRSSPASVGAFLEVLRWQTRQPGLGTDPLALLDTLQHGVSEARDQFDTYQLWFALRHHRYDSRSPRFSRVMQRAQPKYLGLLMQAEHAARQGQRDVSTARYEAAVKSFLSAMVEKMQRGEPVAIETSNQNQDLQELARLYLQIGWWIEAETILFRLAEQEPSEPRLHSLMEILRNKRSRM